MLFQTAAQLVNTLVEALEERLLQRYLKKLDRFHLLICDELGYIPFSEQGAQLLFQVFANRYERASLLVTSNLAFAEWTKVFGEASLTAALLDRLTHHCHIYEFDWESIRLTESLKQHHKKGPKRAVAATATPSGSNKETDQEGTPPKNHLLSGQSVPGTPRRMAGPGPQAGVGFGRPAFAGNSR